MISALLLGWSVAFAWSHLVTLGLGRIGRTVGIVLLAGSLIVFGLILAIFYVLLHGTVPQAIQPHPFAVCLVLFVLLTSSVIGAWLSRHPSSTFFSVVYLWLVRLGEPHRDSVESHPKYLATRLYSRR